MGIFDTMKEGYALGASFAENGKRNQLAKLYQQAYSAPREGRGGNHCYVVYRGARIPKENLIGRPGEGFLLAQKRLGGGRIHHAMRTGGMSYAARLTPSVLRMRALAASKVFAVISS